MKKIFKYKLPKDGEVITIYADIVKWLDIQEQSIWAIIEENGHPKAYEIAAWGCRLDGSRRVDVHELPWHSAG